MAERVTGILGGQPIQLDNAASEATLQLILDAIQRSGSPAGRNSTQSRQEIRDRTELQENIRDESNAHANNTENINRSNNSLGVFSDLLGVISTALKGVEFLFNNTAPTFTGFTNALGKIPAVGGILSSFGNILESQIQSVRTAANIGMNFGDALTSVTSKAIEFGSSVDGMLSVLAAKSTSLAALAGGATEGANLLARITGSLKEGNFATEMYRLGYSVDDLTAYTGDYLEQQQKLGLGQKKTDIELTKGTKEYLVQLDELARVTGLSREEASKQLKEQANNKLLKALYQSIPEIQKNVSGAISVLEAASPDIANSMKELIATNGTPITDFTKNLVLSNQELPELAVKLRAGSISQDQFIAAVKRGAAASKLSAEQASLQAKLAALGKSSYLDAAVEQQKILNISADSLEKAKKSAEDREKSEKDMLTINSKLQDIKNKFIDMLIGTGGIQKLGDIASGLITSLGKIVSNIDSKAVVATFDSITNAIKDWNPMGFIQDIKNFFSGADGKLATAVGAGLLALFAGGAVISMVGSALSAMIGKVGVGAGAGAAGLGRGLGAGVAGLGRGVGAGLGGILSGVASGLAAFANPASLVGLGAVTLAINGIALAIRLAEPGLIPFGNAMKSMLTGVSVVVDSVFKGITSVIDKFSPGFSLLYSEVFKPVMNNIVSAFTWVKDAFTNTFESMWNFGSNIINKISSGFTGLKDIFLTFKDTIVKMFDIVSPIFKTLSVVTDKIVESVSGFFKMSTAAANTVNAATINTPVASNTPTPQAAIQSTEALTTAIVKLNDTLKETQPAANNSTIDLKSVVTVLESVNNRLATLIQLQTEIAPALKQTARNTRSTNMLG